MATGDFGPISVAVAQLAEEEPKHEPVNVTTLLLPMVAFLVLENHLSLRLATLRLVQVEMLVRYN